MKSAEWSLVTYRTPGAADRVGILVQDAVLRAPEFIGDRTMLEVFADWGTLAPQLQAWSPSSGAAVSDAKVLSPILFPNKLICAGANYYGHLAEMGIERPDGTGKPYYFLKPPSTTIVGPGDAIVLPDRAGAQIDWEAELCVVIGRRASGVAASDARSYVAGYTIMNDVSSRDRLRRGDAVAPPFGFDWFSAKCEDTFSPIGPGVVPDWMIDDPQNLAIRLSVNGVVKQDGSTTDMVAGIWDLIAEASRVMTLEPGDILATGTPAGVGVPRGEFLAAGDVVDIDIEGLGRLTNPVVGKS